MQAPSNSVSELISGPKLPAMPTWWERMNGELDRLGWSVPTLAEKMGKGGDGTVIEKLYKYVAGKVENPRGQMVASIAQALSMTETELRVGRSLSTSAKLPTPDGTISQNADIGGPVDLSHRLPLKGHGMGGKDGVLIFDADDNLGTVPAPPGLVGVPRAYAVYVVGNSMLDRYAHGEVVYVNPRLTPHKGDYVVAQISRADGEPDHGFVKRFVSIDEKRLKLQQLNPKKFLTFPRRTVRHVHVIVMGGRG